jgi:hypothetical protein
MRRPALLGLVMVAACGGSPAGSKTTAQHAGQSESGAESGAAAQKTPTDPVEWEPETGALRCRATGTRLSLSQPLRPHVRRLADDTVAAVPHGEFRVGALMVRASRTNDGIVSFVDDWADLHRLISPSAPEDASFQSNVEWSASGDLHRIRVRYVVPEETPVQTYELAYVVVRRNGVSCRLAALEQVDAEGRPGPIAALERISDSPGVAIEPAGSNRSERPPEWPLLRWLLTGGQPASRIGPGR